jgi:plasmid stabilization system protein ParE
MRIEWSSHAVLDLKAISEYIERERSLQTANRVTRAIYDAVQSLRIHAVARPLRAYGRYS